MSGGPVAGLVRLADQVRDNAASYRNSPHLIVTFHTPTATSSRPILQEGIPEVQLSERLRDVSGRQRVTQSYNRPVGGAVSMP